MPTRKFNPTSPGRRHMSVQDFAEITSSEPEKSLLRPLKKSGGRNSNGRITSYHRGGGHKRRYRVIDWTREKDGIPATVHSIQYDPNRSAHIALLHYADGEKRYILAPLGLVPGGVVLSGEGADIKVGNCLPLVNIPIGTQVHAIELKPGKGAQMARAAGTSAQLMAKEGKMAYLRLPSGEVRLVTSTCRGVVGQVGNVEFENVQDGKAGRTRWKGQRGKIRGVATNPCDHPHGGGEARSTPGRPSSTPWGKPALGFRTRKKKASDRLIIRRRKK